MSTGTATPAPTSQIPPEPSPKPTPPPTAGFRVNTMVMRQLTQAAKPSRTDATPIGPAVINGNSSGARWDKGLITEAQRLIPSKASNPLSSQRRFRGIWIIAILVAIVIGIGLDLWMNIRISNRKVIIAPEAQLVGGSGLPTLTDEQVNQFCIGLVQRMETWTYNNANQVPNYVLPFCHPSIHENIRDEYAQIQERADKTLQSRICNILGILWDGKKKDKGLFFVGIVFERIDMAGQEGQNKTISNIDGGIYTFQIVQGPTSSVNPLGLMVMNRMSDTRKHWTSLGQPDFWKQFKMTSRQVRDAQAPKKP